MIKTFCDCCGEVVSQINSFSLEWNRQNNLKKFAPKRLWYDLCPACAEKVERFILQHGEEIKK